MSKDDFLAILARQQQSGLSIKDFCENEAAENTAVICSLLATCKAQKVNPREWLNNVITRLPGYLEKGLGKEVKELLPNAWKIQKSNETPT